MTDVSLEQLQQILNGEGAARRRLHDVLVALLAGEVIRCPDDAASRSGSVWTSFDRYREVIELYVGIAGFRVLVDEEYRFAFLVHDAARLRETLDKHTSRVAVACRLLYHRHQQTVHLGSGIRITMREILDRLDLGTGTPTRTSRSRTIESLRLLARYDMVELASPFAGVDDDTVVLSPVLPRRLPLSCIHDYLERTGAGGTVSSATSSGPAD